MTDSKTGTGKNKVDLEHFIVTETKKVPKEWQRHVKMTWEQPEWASAGQIWKQFEHQSVITTIAIVIIATILYKIIIH